MKSLIWIRIAKFLPCGIIPTRSAISVSSIVLTVRINFSFKGGNLEKSQFCSFSCIELTDGMSEAETRCCSWTRLNNMGKALMSSFFFRPLPKNFGISFFSELII